MSVETVVICSQVIGLFIVLVVLAVLSSIFATTWNGKNQIMHMDSYLLACICLVVLFCFSFTFIHFL